MKEHYECTVIGGGIVGTALTYALSLFGKKALLLERHTVGSGCTGLSAGTIAAAGMGNGSNSDLTAAYHTVTMLRKLEEEGFDAGYEATGALQLAMNAAEKAFLETKYEWFRRNQYDAQFIPDNRSVRQIEPNLSSRVVAALLLPSSGHVDPILCAQAFADAAALNGATVLENTEASSIEESPSGCIISIKGKNGRREIWSDHVVIATGGISKSLMSKLKGGEDGSRPVPTIVPVKGSIWLTSDPLPPKTLRHVIYVAESSKFWTENSHVKPPITHDPVTGKRLITHAYGKQMRDGRIMFGGDRDRLNVLNREDAGAGAGHGDTLSTDPNRLAQHVEYVGKFLPVVASQPVTDSWSGVMPFSEGYEHYEQQLSPRVWFLGGFGSHGVMHGPGYARMFVMRKFVNNA